MSRKLPDPPLLLITDRRAARHPLEEIAAEAFRAGCRWLSLRDKDLPIGERRQLFDRLADLGAGFGATVMCHGETALGSACNGLHLGRDGDVLAARRALGTQALIGQSVHDLAETGAAATAGADYMTFSPIFPSLSKPGHGPKGAGLKALEAAAAATDRPILALGGVTADKASDCLRAGAAGVAVIGAILSAEAPGVATAKLLEALAAG